MKTLEAVRFGTIALLLCVLQTSAMAVTFTHDAFISFADPSYDNQDIVVTNCTLTVDGPHTFQSVTLINGGVLTHSPFTYGPQLFLNSVVNEAQELNATNGTPLNNTNVDTSSIVVMNFSGFTVYTENVDYVVTSSNNITFLTLTTNSAIADGLQVMVSYDWIESLQGFNLAISNNLQIDASSSINVSGKGYAGGLGFQTGAGGNQSTNFPFTFRAGGGGAHGGSGGMSSSSARGGAPYDSISSPANLGSGGGLGTQLGGSGGGVALLTVGGNVQIDGQILANGFKGTNAHSGGGAGGSIFISTPSLSGAGTIAANGGSGDLPDGGGGGGGRIAIVYGTNSFTGNTIAFGGNGANAGGAGTVFMQSTNSTVGQLFIVNGGKRGTNTPFSPLMVNALNIGGGAVAESQNAIFVVTNLFIGSNSWLTLTSAFPFVITASNATVESNGMINADAKSTSTQGTGFTGACGSGAGASYGGFGGASACGSQSGNVYGNAIQPTSPGSQGSFSGGPGRPARGGGAIELNVSGTLSLAGNISANGEAATVTGTGGGSGGSVWLNVGTLLGGGTISANGGSANNLVSGGGGGGRVAVYYNSNALSGSLQAYGGSGTNNGGPGTIYIKQNSAFPSKIIVDNGGRIGSTVLPSGLSNFDLQISGGSILSNLFTSNIIIGNLFIGSNSWFAVSATSPGTGVLNLQVSTNATIQAGGGIIADGISTSTLGAGIGLGTVGGGGGNGGNGGSGISFGTNAPGGSQPAGSFTNPGTPGGLGGAGVSGIPGGKGGGVISLNISGNLQLDGTITANGATGPGFYSGGGAGGSIGLSVLKIFSGSGTISANGGMGNGTVGGNGGGGGGGGHIAISYGTNLFAGGIFAYGGPGAIYGGAGTIYMPGSQIGLFGKPSQLTIDNGGPRGATTPLTGTLIESANLTVIGGGNISNGITSLRVANLLVGSNSVFQSSAPSGGTTQTINATSNITVQAGGSINADGLSANTGNLGLTLNSTGGGGGSAGTGGYSALGAAGGGANSDSLTSPGTTGGRGGNGIFTSGSSINGGFGGGNLRLSANGTLRVDGRISADGLGSIAVNSGGGGAGAVVLSCRTLAGSGTISANGGVGNAAGGGGGGGHISIALSSNAFTGTVTARGGSGANYGGAGFIYAAANTQFPSPGLPPLGGTLGLTAPFPLLTLDNGGVQGAITPLSGALPNSINLTVTGGAIFSNSISLTLQSLFIGSNSIWMMSGPQFVTVTVLTNATIQASGRLTMDGASANPSGQGQSLLNTGGGGGHGGYGGASLSNALGGVTISDSITSPQNPGGRGGNGNVLPLGGNSTGGNGGGALELIVRGTLQLDGRVSADGVTAPSLNSGGGAGGSTWVQAGKLSGTGSISASGGPGNDIGGGGGGGRVAVWYSTNTFTGSITARGGAGGNAGGAGTIYTIANFSNQGRGLITVDNGVGPANATPVLNVTGTPDLIIGNGSSATLAASTAGWNSITISSNALLGLDPTISTLSLTVFSNVTIQAGGAFSLDAHGFTANTGPGHGSDIAGGGSGASHGGLGSQGSQSNLVSTAYDSITNPLLPGSGGGTLTSLPGNLSSAGGGALRLNVIGTLIVNGSISANGNAGIIQSSGGGSGGSLSLSANTFSGTGRISADGGDGEFFGGGGGGGGGRIAVNFSTNKFTGTFSATGGLGPDLAGGAGTIYLKPNFSPIAKLVLDNGGEPGAETPLPQLTLFDLFITNGAVANALTSQTFQNLYIGQGGVFSADASTLLLTMSVLSNAVIDAGGAINADLHLPTAPGLGNGSVDVYGDGSGGGYGGAGGASMFGAPGGATYGFSNAPTSLGSAGGSLPTLPGYSQGGGALRLNVTGNLTVNGSISANGNDGIIDGSGGGSGGSVWISAQSLIGSGSISASGGMGESFEGGGGGGGRIAINIHATNTFAGTILALGGPGAFPGQNGTVYITTNIANLVITGFVSDTNGVPIAGMTVQPSGLSGVTTDANGLYVLNVPPLWSGTVAPISGSVLFIPAQRTYASIANNAINQDFAVAPPNTFNLSPGQVNGDVVSFSFYGLGGITYQPFCSTNMIDWVPYGPPLMGNNATTQVMMSTTNAQQMSSAWAQVIDLIQIGKTDEGGGNAALFVCHPPDTTKVIP